ncbi:hypothetical protein LTS14_007404 [Recurvomyces mirabilis]|uniref:uncharacterized protein n=1 Tax=Recurvomyces mirabilis TaxID=574656 RepID=UPI002DDE9A0F|nr:hypothetical protein LTS14_007404 [Recurvomyces mirabilis]
MATVPVATFPTNWNLAALKAKHLPYRFESFYDGVMYYSQAEWLRWVVIGATLGLIGLIFWIFVANKLISRAWQRKAHRISHLVSLFLMLPIAIGLGLLMAAFHRLNRHRFYCQCPHPSAASVKRKWHLYLLLTLLFGLLPLVLALGSLLHRLIRPKKDALVSKEEQVVVQTTGPDGMQTEEVVQQQPAHSALDGAFDDVELGPVDRMNAHRASVPSYSFLDPMPVAE